VALLEGLRVDALGLNCSLGPEQLLGYVQELAEWSSLPILLNPNAGLPNADGSYDLPPEGFAAGMARLAPYAQLLGGCCGTTPAQIAALKCSTWNIPAPKPAEKAFTAVTSGSRSVRLDGRFAVIGERLNPTGKPKLKQALRDGDTALLLSEAVAQQQAGADLLDVNVGLPEIDERAAMLTAVTEIQAVSPLPLQIDSADPDVLEAALRVYNGKAMVNSVNGKRESLERVLPLVAKYGGVVVGLALDEDGIPDTADGRIAIARRILDAARAYGIRPKDVVIDGLTLAASSGAEAPAVTLETVRRLREELGVRTVLGVSNVSFGLPRRDLLNAAFLTLALGAGLDSAIINPLSGPMMDAVRAYRGLSAQDRDFAEYIANYSAKTEGPSPAAPAAAKQLRDFVENGLSADAERETRALLETLPPMEIIDREILPALDAVGKGYESGRLFLPQLLRAAEAAQAAFAVLREVMGARSENVPRKATVVIATVQGDIHDIGKNIAKVLMQNYGYEVVDLGRDVPPDAIAKAAIAHNAAFVGLSALMTTTVKSMEIAICTLRDAGFSGKIFVSGAVLNEDTARLIRADAYVKDAMAAMAYMESV
jgi:5-methyltetrahydrofolate--homocysteine methyltransferase